MNKPITDDEFGDLLATFSRSAFRLEVQPAYAMSYERDDFDAFLAGTLRPPDQAGWFKPWLDQVARMTAQGKWIGRVRVQAEPPTPYQRWERWVGKWNAAAGESIRYMPRSRAAQLDLPLSHDWWLLDGERVILMFFTRTGELDRKLLADDPGIVAQYVKWRDLAVRNATPAEEYAAA